MTSLVSALVKVYDVEGLVRAGTRDGHGADMDEKEILVI